MLTYPGLVAEFEGVEGTDGKVAPGEAPAQGRYRVVADHRGVEWIAARVPHLRCENWNFQLFDWKKVGKFSPCGDSPRHRKLSARETGSRTRPV